MTAAAQTDGVLLQWPAFAWNEGCEVHRSADPYFTPDAATRLTTLGASGSEYPDAPPDGAWYYVVRAVEDGFGVDSDRTGRFVYDLTPGDG